MAAGATKIVLLQSEGLTVSLPGNEVRFVHGEADGAFSLVEWVAAPGFAGPPLHIHWVTDETFYVLDGTFGFQVGEETLDAAAGTFVFAPKGLVHTFWNQGPMQARMLVTLSPPGFERYFEELAEGLANVGDDAEAAVSVRKVLSKKHDIEVIGSPRQAAD